MYIAGNTISIDGGIPYYWKNGTPYQISESKAPCIIAGIAVLDNDVYLSGTDYQSGNSIFQSVTYWKNGIPYNVFPEEISSGIANGIAVNGQDVHIIGYVNYWKNGIKIDIINMQANDNSLQRIKNMIQIFI
ncbi:hypothetical protein [Niabella ginsengisoli]|uniref:Uncharacterized protein n=1 Tax=Niabella ginsengisoli TaxID=522298 RepID=A0ABS9SJH4_9BACT|nr:hypothetical protein [Niabella ginsengisoli]MCH5598500.1 hypothetical protein [Niabella ginsengisoli]